MVDIADLAKVYLPKYLTPKQSRDLWEELRRFPTIGSFYLPPGEGPDDGRTLQGDGWRGLIVIQFDTLVRRRVMGLIMSNSCDIAPENRRVLPANVVFAPLIALDRYVERLREAGQSTVQIASLLKTIRRQEMTALFYLPGWAYGPPESVVLLDDMHSYPATHFFAAERARVFRLNMVAYYVFLLKLSIHFSRFQEGVSRFPA